MAQKPTTVDKETNLVQKQENQTNNRKKPTGNNQPRKNTVKRTVNNTVKSTEKKQPYKRLSIDEAIEKATLGGTTKSSSGKTTTNNQTRKPSQRKQTNTQRNNTGKNTAANQNKGTATKNQTAKTAQKSSGKTQNNTSNRNKTTAGKANKPVSSGQKNQGNKRNATNNTARQAQNTQRARTNNNKTTANNSRKTNNQRGRKTNSNEQMPLRIIPLGGLNEIGKNITAYEYNNEMFIVDCGLTFPDAELFGVDLVIPDFSYLIENKHKIKGLVITHGHEDHIGAIPYLLKQINIPVYAKKLTLSLISGKLEEHGILKSSSLNEVEAGDSITLAGMDIEFIHVNHSIPDAVSLAIHTPVGTVIQTGDFKVDFTPIKEPVIDLNKFAEEGSKGVKLLLSDSTNAETPGFCKSESTVGPNLESVFARAGNKRLIIASFASNVYRLQQIVNTAHRFGRKVAVSGRSMVNVTERASELGYLNIEKSALISLDEIGRYNPEQLVLLTTGSQGEPMAALSRMASGSHRQITVTQDDIIVFSSKTIPGNEKMVTRVINGLLKTGCEVVYGGEHNLHVSGHAHQDELRLMLSLTKPEFFLPVHGEYKHLKKHAQIAIGMGVAEENIIISSIGQVLELREDSFRMAETVTAGRVLVDGLGVGDVGSIVLRDRKHLSEDGLIVVVATIDSNSGEFVSGPDIVSRGFVYVRESEELMADLRQGVENTLRQCEEESIKEWGAIKVAIRENLSHEIYKKTKRSPMILPIITEI